MRINIVRALFERIKKSKIMMPPCVNHRKLRVLISNRKHVGHFSKKDDRKPNDIAGGYVPGKLFRLLA